ncbi:MAG TPA: hypothetical protein V6D06_19285 [Trichocoleus sp.]
MAAEGLIQALLGIARVYVERYGMPDSLEQLQSIVGSLISVGQRAEDIAPALANALALPNPAVEALIQQVATWLADGASPGAAIDGALDETIDSTKQALVEQAYQWRQRLISEVKETLHAYVQRFAPQLDFASLPDTIEAIIPLVQDGRITRAEVSDLVRQIAMSFGPQVALSQGIEPQHLEAAQALALSMAQKPMEQAVMETVVAYMQKFEPAMEAVSEELIEKAIGALSNLPIEFDWAMELSLKDKRLLIKQVAFKLNIMQASPPPSQTAQELADQVHSEIQQFRQEREASIGTVDVTKGFTSSDGLEVSSGWSLPSKPPET